MSSFLVFVLCYMIHHYLIYLEKRFHTCEKVTYFKVFPHPPSNKWDLMYFLSQCWKLFECSRLLHCLIQVKDIDFVFLQVNIARRSFLEIAIDRQLPDGILKILQKLTLKYIFHHGKGSCFIKWNCWILIWLFLQWINKKLRALWFYESYYGKIS